MIISYLIFIIIGVVVFFIGRYWPMWVRIAAALLAVLVPSIALTFMIVLGGDS